MDAFFRFKGLRIEDGAILPRPGRWVCTALRNHNRAVFGEMTSWTALSSHIVMKTAF